MSGYHELKPIYDRQKSFYRKAFVRDCHSYSYLISYNTPVILVDYNDDTIHRLWDGYSVTTMRHINEFLKQNANMDKSKWFSKSEWDNMTVERSSF